MICVANPTGIYLFKVNKRNTRTTSMTFWCRYCELLIDFPYSSGVSMGDFEQVNAGWELTLNHLAKSTLSSSSQDAPRANTSLYKGVFFMTEETD